MITWPLRRRDMVKSLLEEDGSDDPHRRATVELIEKSFASFLRSATTSFLDICRMDASFLTLGLIEWPNNQGCTLAPSWVKKLHTVNNFAEQGIALMQDFNLVFTKDEEQRQFISQVAEKHRRNNVDARKFTGLRTRLQWVLQWNRQNILTPKSWFWENQSPITRAFPYARSDFNFKKSSVGSHKTRCTRVQCVTNLEANKDARVLAFY